MGRRVITSGLWLPLAAFHAGFRRVLVARIVVVICLCDEESGASHCQEYSK